MANVQYHDDAHISRREYMRRWNSLHPWGAWDMMGVSPEPDASGNGRNLVLTGFP